MDLKFIGAGSAGMPPYVKPVLHAFNRLQQRTMLHPGELTNRALVDLAEQFGTGATAPEAAFAHGVTGLISEHTHYFDGFALLMPLPHGTAVAMQPTEGRRGRLTFEGASEVWTFDLTAPASEQRPSWVRIVEALVRRFIPAGTGIDIAVVSTIHSASADGYLAALGVATVRALQALFAVPLPVPRLMRLVAEVIADGIGHPFSVAYPVAAHAEQVQAFLLVDTATREYLPLDMPSREVLGWGLVDVKSEPLRDAVFYWKRREQADEALKQLQQKGFARLTSYRELEHRDLQRAMGTLSRSYRSTVRHLVTENRRVQRMVMAIRNEDWQMLGALLLMTHASLKEDWKGTRPEVDFVVRQVTNMSLEGLYGACMTDAGGRALLVGQSFTVPQGLDRITDAFEEEFGYAPDTELL